MNEIFTNNNETKMKTITNEMVLVLHAYGS